MNIPKEVIDFLAANWMHVLSLNPGEAFTKRDMMAHHLMEGNVIEFSCWVSGVKGSGRNRWVSLGKWPVSQIKTWIGK